MLVKETVGSHCVSLFGEYVREKAAVVLSSFISLLKKIIW